MTDPDQAAADKAKAEIAALPGIKEDALVALGKCPVCGEAQLATGEPTFYRVKVERGMFDLQALKRRIGLTDVMHGSVVLARVMGPDEPLARVFDGPREVFVHKSCAHKLHSLLLLFPE